MTFLQRVRVPVKKHIFLNREVTNQSEWTERKMVSKLRSEFSSGSKPKIDLNEIFGRETLTALELLSIPDIVSEVKSNSETFSTFLKARPDLVQQLIDVTLRP